VDILLDVIRGLRARGLAIVYVSHRLEEIFAVADTVTVLRDGQHVVTAPTADLTRESLIRHMVGRDVAEEFPAREARPGETALDVRDLSAPPRFSRVSFDLRRGEIVGLAGLVGAGRSSAALAIAGGLHATGRMTLAGRSVSFRTPAAAIAGGIAYVTEDRKARGIFPAMGVDDNILVTHLSSFARGGWLASRRQRSAVSDAMRRFDIRAAGPRQRAGTLSGGNQQKALVARYLVKPPDVLILDEPTRGVDVGARAEIYRLMNSLTAEGLAILMISSDLPEVLGMSDRIVVMREGRTTGELVRAEATPERVMALATAGQS
jgi:ABC-type sugar transport system ATPase subunit